MRPSVQWFALFSPEHGLAGRSDEKIASTKESRHRSFPFIVSMAKRGDPPMKCSRELTHLFRCQDAGVRFYLYATMGLLHGGSSETKHRFLRARPAKPPRRRNYRRPMLDADKTNFVAYSVAGALRADHGELAQFIQRRKSHRRGPARHHHEELHRIISSKAPASSDSPSPNLRPSRGLFCSLSGDRNSSECWSLRRPRHTTLLKNLGAMDEWR